jgi:ABC-type bacteriocin/lantibiotic exporter with double-glycine peptidase domain
MIDFLVSLLLTFMLTWHPYVSQEGNGADQRANDCGGAVISMLVQSVTSEYVPVDQIMGSIPDRYTTVDDLKDMAEPYGIELDTKWFNDPVTLREYLQEQGTVILVVRYYDIRPELRYLYIHHWIWLIGVEGDEFVYHDPLAGAFQTASAEDLFKSMDNSYLSRSGVVVTNLKEAP